MQSQSILGSDIACLDDVIIEDGDFAVVSDLDCLKQDIAANFETPPADNPDMPFSGTLKPRLMPEDGLAIEKAHDVYESALASDPRIKADTIKLEEYVDQNGKTAFSASFETIDNQIVENFIL